ncbi:MAG: secretin N-terminal domain-containing protein [Pyrinomonadaceae bacterium]
MKRNTTPTRRLASLLVAFCLLAAPVSVLAKKGEKNFKRGREHEAAQQWDRAAQEYALAIAANPSEIEYQLHYRRSVFQASQKFMEQGRSLAEQGDLKGAYNAYRQAYGYDPVNELALNEMQRMLRLQREKDGLGPDENGGAKPQMVPSAYRTGEANGTASSPTRALAQNGSSALQSAAPRAEQQRIIKYGGDLEAFVRQMAKELELNVLFDRDFPKRTINVELSNVTAARALDHIFLSQNLFYQKLDRRTILVADQSKRPQYQQLVLRTFYLQNIEPDKARTVIQSALPPNAGRQATVVPNKETNSITVRDTPENVRLISQLIQSIDKDRAEVVMDVQIYEVSNRDLLSLGNQIGNEGQLGNLGGTQRPLALLLGDRGVTAQALGAGASTALGSAILLPTATLSAFQSKSKTRLVASTQVHAFDNEQSTTRIGQKVPVQTAQVSNFGFNNTGTNTGNAASGVFGGGNGFPVIQYQDTGLILKFTPQVFPNHDVQVKMEIESNDTVAGPDRFTPIFSQRNVSGMARIPNNRTMMIASVAQQQESRGRQGLPLLGLIPVLGRLFSTPTRNDVASDIVITVTPRVLRAPNVTPEDLEMRPSGTIQSPTSDSLEAMVRDADREDQLAAARQIPTNQNIQLPSAPPQGEAAAATTSPAAAATTAATAAQPAAATTDEERAAFGPVAESPSFVPAPIILSGFDAGASGLPVANTVDAKLINAAAASNSFVSAAAPENRTREAAPADAPSVKAPVALHLTAGQREMRAGERQRVMLFVRTDVPLGLVAAALRFDPKILRVVSIAKGSIFGEAAETAPTITPSIDAARGSVLALVAPQFAAPINGAGVLLFVEVEAVAAGETELGFEAASVHLMSKDGRHVPAQLNPVRLTVK